ncbi:MAG: InlB B-repeat-containing protein [Clostridiales bacterium]|nr:InlB B-repeat-containing protein [Clostridiales bacterium]
MIEFLDCKYNEMEDEDCVVGISDIPAFIAAGGWGLETGDFLFWPQNWDDSDIKGPLHPGDVAAINGIIQNNGLDWPLYNETDWTSADWPGVEWEEEGGFYRVMKLDISQNYDEVYGSMDLTALDALRHLDCYWNELTSLDVSGLENLEELSCSFNYNLEDLMVGGCTSLEYLDCYSCSLTSLDLSGCASLEEVRCAVNQLDELYVDDCSELWYLHCDDNNLSSLDVTDCTVLFELDCSRNKLAGLDVSTCEDLYILDCSRNQLGSLIVDGCTDLDFLDCSWNKLTSLDVTDCTALYHIDCSYNQIESKGDVLGVDEGDWDGEHFIFDPQMLPVAGVSAADAAVINDIIDNNGLSWPKADTDGGVLTTTAPADWTTGVFWSDDPTDKRIVGLDLEYDYYDPPFENQLEGDLDVSGLDALKSLWCDNNHLTSLLISGCTLLEELKCSSNWLELLDVTGLNKLTYLDCGYNAIKSLDVSGCALLEDLYCYGNNLESLDVSGLAALQTLSCWDNNLRSLEYEGCIALLELNCSWNRLDELDVSGLTNLVRLDFSGNNLETLEITGLTDLYELVCSYNRLASIKVADCSALNTLVCQNNQLAELEITGCLALNELDCRYNQLASLDLSGSPDLGYLYCQYNELVELDLTENDNLQGLECSYNMLTSLDVTGLGYLNHLDCSFNHLPNEAAVKGFAGEWNGDNYIFYPQRTPGEAPYHPGDVAVINRIIDENGLDLMKAPPSGNYVPENWEYTVWWTYEETGKRVTELYIGDWNLYGDLDLSGLEALEWLSCWYNRLVSIDVSGCTSLLYLDCTNNFLPDEDAVKGFTGVWDDNYYCFHPQRTIVFSDECDIGDLAVINKIIKDNGLDWWEPAPTDGSRVEIDWPGVAWSDAKTGKRVVGLDVTDYDLEGDLDVSGLSELTHLYCWENRFESIDAEGLAKLEYIDCEDNRLKTLTLTGCTSLETLYCAWNKLQSLDVSGLSSLHSLYCAWNELTELELEGCTALETLYCYTNKLEELDLGGLYSLNDLDCGNNKLTSLDVRGLCLMYLDCTYNYMPDEDAVTGFVDEWDNWNYFFNPQYTIVDRTDCDPVDIAIINNIIDVNGLDWEKVDGGSDTIDWPGVRWSDDDKGSGKRIEALYIESKGLTGAIDVSGLDELEAFSCFNNIITSIDAHGLNKLVYLDCDWNNDWMDGSGKGLTSLNITGCTSMIALYATDNKLASIDFTGCDDMVYLYIGFNEISSLTGLGAMTGLRTLYCYSNELSGTLDLSGSTELEWLDCGYNKLTGLNVSGLTSLTELRCQNNRLGSLDLSGLTSLETLYCEYNNLMGELDVSGLGLRYLDIAGNSMLERLDCSENNLTWLDLDECNSLEYLDCRNNYFIYEHDVFNTWCVDAFDGWDGVDFIFYPQNTGTPENPQPGKYRITFDTAATDAYFPFSYGPVYYSISVYIGKNKAYGKLPAPKLDGFTFAGWYTDLDEDYKAAGNKVTSKTKATKNTTLYAKWKPKTYKVKYDANGGKIGKNKSRTINHKADAAGYTLPAAPTRAGYTFVGWYRNKACTDGPVRASTQFETMKNHTLFAKWKGVSYDVEFRANGGGDIVSYDGNLWPTGAPYKMAFGALWDSGPSGTLPVAKPTAAMAGQGLVFKGWSLKAKSGSKVVDGTVWKSGPKNAVLYAQFAKAVTISFDTDGGKKIKGKTVKTAAGTKYPTLPKPKKAGYVFGGWYDSGDTLYTTEIKKGDIVDSEVREAVHALYAQTLVAKWTPGSYTVKFNGNKGTLAAGTGNIDVNGGSSLGALPEKPTRKGFEFTGWYTKKSGGVKADAKTVVTKSMTLHAQWTSVAKTVKFKVNGGKLSKSDSSRTVKWGGYYGRTYNKNTGLTVRSPLPTPTPPPNNVDLEFDGWYTTKTDTAKKQGVRVDDFSKVEFKGSSQTLYARWGSWSAG